MNSGELNNKLITDVAGRITEDGYNNSGTHMVPENCVLIGLAGQGKTRGTAAYNLIPLCTNQSIASILPNEKEFHSLYLFHYIDSQYDALRLLSAGDGGRGGLNKQIILSLQFPLPPTTSEQRRIASVLSDTDYLIASLSRTIEKKRLVKQGAMQQLLTGKTRLKGFYGNWVEKTIGGIGDTYNGITGKTKADFGIGNSRYITFLNVLNNPIIDTSILERVNIEWGEGQNEVRKGDLFFNTSSETPEEVGICATLKHDLKDVYLNSFCFGFRITDDEVDNEYLAYYFRGSEGRYLMTTLAQGATRYNLSKDNFNKSVITLPPTKKEQQAIANILTTMDDEITALEAERDKYICIKRGMMQKLLTGEIRLPICQTTE